MVAGLDSNHFNAESQIRKFELNDSTFDIVDVDSFHNVKASTVFNYLMVWFTILLTCALLGTDVYTCLSILVFHHWSSQDYQPYEYSVAKWIFTGCIIFEFCLLFYHWIWAIHTYRKKNIALTYLNPIARNLYTIRSYNYFCLFNSVEKDNFFDWSCFYCYEQRHNALQILVADAPRQVINFLTLRFYCTGGELNNDILANIKHIATTNLTLSIILSLMCLSVVIFAFFFFCFLFGLIMYIPVKVKLRDRETKSLKKYCCVVVNDTVKLLVLKHHKSKKELLDKGILDSKAIDMNPLLNSSTTTFNKMNFSTDEVDSNYEYKSIAPFPHNLKRPAPSHTFSSNAGFNYNDNKKLQNFVNRSHESLPLNDLDRSGSNLQNPFSDNNRPPPSSGVQKRPPPPFTNPFESNSEISLQDPQNRFDATSLTGYSKVPIHPPRSTSQSSLTHSSPFQNRIIPEYTAPERTLNGKQSQSTLQSEKTYSRPHNNRTRTESSNPRSMESRTNFSEPSNDKPESKFNSPFNDFAHCSQETVHSIPQERTYSQGSDNYNHMNESTTGLLTGEVGSSENPEGSPSKNNASVVPYPTEDGIDATPYPIRGISVYDENYKYVPEDQGR